MYYFMLHTRSGEYYTVAPPEIILYAIRNNYTKFGAFVHFVPKSSKFTTKQSDYYHCYIINSLWDVLCLA